MRASGGSLYLITTPRYVLVSSVSAPDSPKFGFSFSTGGLSGLPKLCSSFSSRCCLFSLRRSSCCCLSACWEASVFRSLRLSLSRSLSRGLSDVSLFVSHLLRLSSGCSFLLLCSSLLVWCPSCSRLTLISAGRWGLRLLLFLGDLLPRPVGDVPLLPEERSLVLLVLCGLELPLDLDLERRVLCGLTGLSFSCFILTFDSRSGESLLLCRFSFVILVYIGKQTFWDNRWSQTTQNFI